jgi:hypothetical protein
MKRSAVGAILLCVIVAPFSAGAQESDLKAEIRAALLNADGSETLTDDEFSNLTDALTAQASVQQVSAGDIAGARAEALFVENPTVAIATEDTDTDWTPIAGTTAFFGLLWLLVWYWRRLHHGGALGHHV